MKEGRKEGRQAHKLFCMLERFGKLGLCFVCFVFFFSFSNIVSFFPWHSKVNHNSLIHCSLILYEEAILFSHCVVLLDGVDVESLQLHHRLDVSFECVELSEPETTMEENFRIIVIQSFCKLLIHSSYIPCNLSTSLGLLCDLGEFSVAALFGEDVCRLGWLKSM